MYGTSYAYSISQSITVWSCYVAGPENCKMYIHICISMCMCLIQIASCETSYLLAHLILQKQFILRLGHIHLDHNFVTLVIDK